MDLGRDPREGFHSFFGVDCYQGCWLCAYIDDSNMHPPQPVGSLSLWGVTLWSLYIPVYIHEGFKMALQHKSNLCTYRELKWKVGFEEYLNFCWGTHGLFEELGRHTNRGGSKECPDCGACKKSVEHVPFEGTTYDSQRQNFWLLQAYSVPDAFSFLHNSIFDKAIFCLGKNMVPYCLQLLPVSY